MAQVNPRTALHDSQLEEVLDSLLADITAIRTSLGGILTATATYNPGNLADGAGETSSSITVTGAALGDGVIVAAPYDLQGLSVTGYVDATNSVKIRVQNESGGAVDLASGTWRVFVFPAATFAAPAALTTTT